MRWIARAAIRLVPASWRETVWTDLDEEARAEGHGNAWLAWQIARTAARLRSSLTGDLLLMDLRHAVRSLVRAKGFAAMAVITLVLGIGVNLAVFAVVDRVLFRPLPFAHMDRLVLVSEGGRSSSSSGMAWFSRGLFVEARQSLTAIEDQAYVGQTGRYRIGSAAGDAAAPTLGLTDVSYNLLDVLGTVPTVGRGFLRDDALEGRALAMLTYETWQGRFGGSEAAIGMTLRQSTTVEATIIGVLPPNFIVPAMHRDPEFDGVVMAADALESPGGPVDSVASGAHGVARLAPGVSMAAAQQQYDALAARLEPELRVFGEARGPRARLEALRPAMFSFVYEYYWLTAAAAAFVWLLACANLSSLLLARGRSREQQVALRASLGASTSRLLTAELLQCLIVCAVAAAISMALIGLLGTSLRSLAPTTLRPFVLSGVDARLAALAGLAALASCLVAGLVPAWRASRTDLLGVMQREAGAPAHARRSRPGKVVLAVEAALGVVLVAGGAIAARNAVGLATTDVGFTPDGLQIVRILPTATGDLREIDPSVVRARHLRVLDAIRRQPGVTQAGAIDAMPGGGYAPMFGATWAPGVSSRIWQITDGLLDAIGARLVAGRDITRDDVERERAVALVTEAAARQLWPGEPPAAAVGRVLAASGSRYPPFRVVGVVADILDRPDRAADPRVFVPAGGDWTGNFYNLEFVVRTSSSRPALDGEFLSRQLAGDFDVARVLVAPAGDAIASALQQPRVQAILFGSFALVGLFLAALGLFAVASFDVALRRYELGIRAALGAHAGRLRREVVADAIRPVAVGAVAGLVITWWAAGFMQSLVYGIDARSPATLAIVVVALLLTAVAAAWLPARAASRLDPMEVLRRV